MIEFSNLTAEDYRRTAPVLRRSGIENWEHNFATVLVWSRKYDIKVAVVEGTVFFLSENDGTGWYIFPCGKMDTKQAVDLILQDASERGIKAMLYGIDEKSLDALNALYPDKFLISEDRDDEDYIYLAEDLINLRGKKYRKKRNHISRFKRDFPDYTYSPITRENIHKAREFEATWNRLYNSGEDDNLDKEGQGIADLLDNFEKLELMGAMIEIDGRPVAISIASKLSERMVDVIVEKAYKEVDSAYAVINQEFARNRFKDYTYINREDDMGVENLRQAKLRYFPCEIKKKYTALYKG